MQSFQSQVLKQQWQDHQSHILQKAKEREDKESERRKKQEKDLDGLRAKQEKIHKELEAAVDIQRSKLSDALTALEYDLSCAEKKIVHTIKVNTTSGSEANPCLEERVALVNCLQTTKTPGTADCTFYVGAVEKCNKQSISA